jgi:hypothetical protein
MLSNKNIISRAVKVVRILAGRITYDAHEPDKSI